MRVIKIVLYLGDILNMFTGIEGRHKFNTAQDTVVY